ncbi:MAG: rod shape-determining protein RodA [Candidatus Spechtbacterales bacterium]|nr:rod shape-determining protein RodA [Candidatus Spechtbacterales bacterium]
MSFTNKKIFQGYDWMLLAASISLAVIGLISLFSVTRPGLTNFYKQIIWLVLGIGVFFFFASIDYRLLRVHFSPVLFLYFLGLLGLVIVYFAGSQIRGARSWISVGPFNIEPVEALKLILIFILAKYFSRRHVEMYRFKNIVISGIYVLLPASLVLLQPDFGSFAILGAIWVGIMIVAGIKIKHLAVLGLIAAILFTFAWSFFLQPYQKDRINTFFDPTSDPHGAGYNAIQAQIAVGSGGIWGKGFAQGTQAQLGFLPEAHTDFIFASTVEEFGAVTAIAIILLYGVLFWRLMYISKYASDNFARLTIIGISVMIISQLFFNIAMTLGLMPITGLPLPFISYGGSSLITLFLAIGVAESIYRHSTLRSIGTE